MQRFWWRMYPWLIHIAYVYHWCIFIMEGIPWAWHRKRRSRRMIVTGGCTWRWARWPTWWPMFGILEGLPMCPSWTGPRVETITGKVLFRDHVFRTSFLNLANIYLLSCHLINQLVNYWSISLWFEKDRWWSVEWFKERPGWENEWLDGSVYPSQTACPSPP